MKEDVFALFEKYDIPARTVEIDRNNYEKGQPAWSVHVVVYGDPKSWMEWKFAKINHMDEKHMLNVIESYLVSRAHTFQEGKYLEV